jgi:hypothetical protein
MKRRKTNTRTVMRRVKRKIRKTGRMGGRGKSISKNYLEKERKK